MALALPVLAPPAPAGVEVLVAARDLPAGHVFVAGDLIAASWPPQARPDGVLAGPVTGRVTAAPMRRGEPVTDARVVGPGLLAGAPSGTLAVAVRPADPAALLLLRQGDLATVLAGGAPGDPGSTAGQERAEVVVGSARVLAVPGSGAGGGGGTGDAGGADAGADAGGGLLGVPAAPADGTGAAGVVVLAVQESEAARVAAAAGTRALTVALRGP